MSGYYRKLDVWQKAFDLAQEVYSLCRMLPKEEIFALDSQMRRAAVSIPSNITEGYGRGGHKDFARFFNIANVSRMELETQILLCLRLKYLPAADTENALVRLEKVGKMIAGLIKSLKMTEDG